MTNVHSVLTFDGVNDYVEISPNATLNLVDNFTIEAWIKPKTSGKRIVDKGVGGRNEGFTFDIFQNKLRFINKGVHFTSHNPLKIGAWQHVTVTFKHEANGAKLYINGEGDNTATPNQVGNVTNLPVRLGSQADKLESLFKGEMAEVRIWNCVRTPAEIQQNMHRRLNGNEPGLVGYWPLNEGSRETLGDRSANSNNGTIHGATWETAEVPITRQSKQRETHSMHNILSFDGKDDYIATNLDAQPKALPDTTWEAWVKPIGDPNAYGVFLSTDDGYWDRLVCIYTQKFGISNGNNLWLPVAFDFEQWQHIAVVYTASKDIKFYKNGVEYTYDGKSSIGSTHNTFHIGHNSAGNVPYQGSICEVRVWNCVRTPAQIQRNMHHRLKGNEDGLVGYWPLNEGSGETASDRSASGNNSPIHGATWETAEVPITLKLEQREAHPAQNILSLDGKNDYIATSLDAQPKALPNTTWEAWVKPTGNPNGSGMILSTYDGGWDRLICMYDKKIGVSNGHELWSPVAFDFEQWQHIAVIYTASKEVKLYKNGMEYTYDGKSSIGDTQNTLHIGHHPSGSYPYQGSICEVRIWNCVRTPSEIEQNMHRRLKGNEDGLVGYWPLDEGSGETASDRSANGNHGTIHGATWQTAEVPIQERPSQQFQGTGLADYGYWYHWEKNLPKPTQKKPFRRGRIWA